VRIACVGGGPAGLYFAILAKRIDPQWSVTVYDRFPEGVTYGWGVVFWDGLLDDLERTDPDTGREVRDRAFRWVDQLLQVDGQAPFRMRGHGFSMRRQTLLAILAERARELGVDVRFGQQVDDLTGLGDCDLVVASDGVNSRLRERHRDDFGTAADRDRNKYAWLGTSKVFDSFTFPFAHTDAGWIWGHAYGFESGSSTFIAETTPETWKALGFDVLSPEESTRRLEDIFGAHLGGHALTPQAGVSETTLWREFLTVTNRRWHRGNVALMGDAAHTTHFTIGSGTRLALEDAIGLARQLAEHQGLDSALAAYGKQRAADLKPAQREARNSARWFENVARHVGNDPEDFARLMNRRRSSFINLMPSVYLRLAHAAARLRR
jgi:anthraniloyl-CoA monooxygenase